MITPIARWVGNPALVILLLALLVIIVRLVLPMVPAGSLLIALVPSAQHLGLSGWVVGFVAVMVLTGCAEAVRGASNGSRDDRR